jgi:hypothetical protein
VAPSQLERFVGRNGVRPRVYGASDIRKRENLILHNAWTCCLISNLTTTVGARIPQDRLQQPKPNFTLFYREGAASSTDPYRIRFVRNADNEFSAFVVCSHLSDPTAPPPRQ